MNGIFGIMYKEKSRPADPGAARQALGGRYHPTLVVQEQAVFATYRYRGPGDMPEKTSCWESDDLLIITDSRIDNKGELFRSLGIEADEQSPVADVRILAAAFRKWGARCVEHLEGEFAFCIRDKRSGDLFMATDPLGQRYFFYYDSPEQFIFCSELEPLLVLKPRPHYFDLEFVLNNYQSFPAFPFNTYTREVKRSANASTFTWKNDRLSTRQYWQLEPTGKYTYAKNDWAEALRHQIRQAVARRLDYRLNTGICLSGGLDSSGLACLLSELLLKKNKALYAFSSVLTEGHEGIERDERAFIQAVGRKCPNLVQSYVDAPGAGPLTGLSAQAFDAVAAMPPASGYVTRAILETAKRQNIHSLFWGLAGDTWPSWGGSGVAGRLLRSGKFGEALPLLAGMSQVEQRSLLRVAGRELLLGTALFDRYISLKMSKNGVSWKSQTCLHPDLGKLLKPRRRGTGGKPRWAQVRDLADRGTLSCLVLPIKNDARAYGMEAEIPFLDKQLCEFLADVPEEYFLPNGIPRGLYREAMKGIIPEEILRRGDKRAYAPDFNRRALAHRAELAAVFNHPGYEFVFKSYIDKPFALSTLGLLEPANSVFGATPEKVLSRRVSEAAIICQFLAHLRDKDYVFR